MGRSFLPRASRSSVARPKITISTTTNKAIGQGNGATTNWPFGFKIPDAASLVVIYTDANGALTTLNAAQYSVAGLGADAGGSVTYPLTGAPIALGTTLTVLRTVAYNQQSSVRNQSGFFPDVYEAALDYLTMQTQQLQEIAGRCAQIASTVSGVTMTMPAPLAGASIGWNSTATGLANITTLVGGVALPLGINQGGTGQTTATTARAALGFPAIGTDGYPLVPVSGSTAYAHLPPALGYNLVGGYLDWTVAGNVLTCAVKTWLGNDPSAAEPVWYAVRDVTPATGTLTYRKLTAALSVTLANTALAGTVNAFAFKLWAVIVNDAGVDRLTLINCLTTSANAGSGRNADAIFPLAGWGICTTVLSDAASDNAQVFYANAVAAAKPYATVGWASWEAGLAAAGVWSAGPTRKQLFGPGVPLPGTRIQSIRTQPGAVIAGAVAIPHDDTIPQNTEGTQAYSLPIASTSAANVLEISSGINAAQNTGGAAHVEAAIFVDAVLNSVTAGDQISSVDGTNVVFQIRANLLASAIASVKMRFGNNAGATTYLNGISGGGRVYGAVAGAFLQVDEVMA